MDEYEKLESELRKVYEDYIVKFRCLTHLEQQVEEFERLEQERMEERKLATKKILERMKQDDALRSFDGSGNGGGGGGGGGAGSNSDIVSDDDLDSESDDDDTMDDEVGGVGGKVSAGGKGAGRGGAGGGRKSAKRPNGPTGNRWLMSGVNETLLSCCCVC